MNKKNIMLIVHVVIMAIIYFVISNLTPVEPLTKQGLQVLAIVVAFVYGRITIDAVIPSFMALFMFATTGLNSIPGTFMAAGGHFAVMMVLALMMLGGIMSHTGLAEALARRIISAKIANGKPWVLTCFIFLAAMIPSMFLTAIPVLIIVWQIAKEIFHLVGFQKGDKWPVLIMAGITGTAAIAISTMPFSMGVATDFGVFQQMNQGEVTLPSIPFLLTALLFDLLVLVLILLITRFVFRPDVTKLKEYKASKPEPFTTDQKRALVLLVLFVVIVLLPDCLPMCGFKMIMAQFGTMGGGFFVVMVALFIRNKDGSAFITIKDIAKGVYWDLLIMIMALMVVCGSLTNPELGVGQFIANLLTPLCEAAGPFGAYGFMQIFSLIGTNLLDNAVVGMSMASIVTSIGPGLGASAVAVFCFILHTAEYGVLLPCSSPLSAMTYQQCEDGWLKKKDIFITGLLYMLSCFIVIGIIGYFFLPAVA